MIIIGSPIAHAHCMLDTSTLAIAMFGDTHDVSSLLSVSVGDLRVVLMLGLVANSSFLFIQR